MDKKMEMGKKIQLQLQAGAIPCVGKDLPHHGGEWDAQCTTRAELAEVWPLTSAAGGYLAGSHRGSQIKCYIAYKGAVEEGPTSTCFVGQSNSRQCNSLFIL